MRIKLTAILTVVLLLSTQVLATTIDGTITASYTGTGAADTMTIWGGGLINYNVSAGVYLLNKTADTGDGSLFSNGTIGVFCIDLLQTIKSGSQTYDIILASEGPQPTTFLGTEMGATKAAYLAELWTKYYDSSWSSGGTYTEEQKSLAGAFAAAVWEIVYEDLPTSSSLWDVTIDSTLGSGGFKASGLDYSTANNWLHSLTGTYTGELLALSNCGSQDFIFAIQDPSIPEPTTVAFMALGLFFVIGRKRTAKTA